MATRLRYNLNVNIEHGLFKRDLVAAGREVELTDQGAASGIMGATTASDGVALDVGDVTTPGWLYLRNLDETNFAVFGPDNGAGALIEVGYLKPGEEAWFRLHPTATLRIAGDTSTVKIQYELFSD